MRKLFLAFAAFAALVNVSYAQVALKVEGAVATDDCVEFKDARTLRSAGGACGVGGGGSAPTDASYVVGAANGTLTNEIVASANAQVILGHTFAQIATDLGLVIGTNVQAFDADLTTYAGITPSASAQTLLASTVGTAANANTGTSGATVPLLNAANTFSGSSTFSNTGSAISVTAGILSNTNATSSGATNLISVTGALTGSSAAKAFSNVATWNTSGAPDAFFANITNTASAAAARLLDLQVASSSKFDVDVAGNVTQKGTLSIGAPTAALATAGASSALLAQSGQINGVLIENTAASGSSVGSFVSVYSNDGAALASGDRLGGLIMGGSISASAVGTGSRIETYTTEAWSATNKGNRIAFLTIPNASATIAERWYIDQDGTFKPSVNNTAATDVGDATHQTRTVFVGTSIELGATDTTLARSGPGAMTIEGINVATTSNSITFSNKTITAPIINGAVTGTMTVPQEAYTDAGWNGDAAAADRDGVRDRLASNGGFRGINAGDQAGITDATVTTVTIDTEAFDVGSQFASSAWTPDAGVITLGGCAYSTATFTAGDKSEVLIYKDGAVLVAGALDQNANIANRSACVSISDLANGSNVYTLRVFNDATGNGTSTVKANSTTTPTYFWGFHN